MSDSDSVFDFDEMGVCIKDTSSSKVLFQNDLSKQVCGDQTSLECQVCGTASVVKIGEHACEFSRFPASNDKTMSVFYLTDKQVQEFRELFQKSMFTEQEMAVGLLLLQHKTNPEICAELFVSLSTLKTHLNHMYRKCPELKKVRGV